MGEPPPRSTVHPDAPKAYVHMFVGQEPSGRAFNDFALTRQEHPFNPVTNAGAIVTCSMIDEHNPLPVVPGDACSARMESRLRKYNDGAGHSKSHCFV